jgi:molybdate/tungstate transport system substrate-binding protein
VMQVLLATTEVVLANPVCAQYRLPMTASSVLRALVRQRRARDARGARVPYRAHGPQGPRGARATGIASTAIAAVAGVSVIVVSSALTASTSAAAGSRVATHRAGTADVAFAGSLLVVDDTVVGPGFERATGYGFTGRGGGSIGLAHEISAGEISPGVFESVGAAPIATLEPHYTRWYVRFASSPLVLAYNPHGRYAGVFRAGARGKGSLAAVFEAMARPGFLLGRTDPATDPQGQAFVMMVELAQRYLHLPPAIVDKILGPGATTGTGGNPSQIFAETALDSHLEAGQLDAASAFLPQAVQLHLPYVRLPAAIDFGDPADAKRYASARMVVPSTTGAKTTVHGTPLVIDVTALRQPSATKADVAADNAFVAYQLSAAGRRAYAKEGFTLLPNTLFGPRGAVPAPVRRELSRTTQGP